MPCVEGGVRDVQELELVRKLQEADARSEHLQASEVLLRERVDHLQHCAEVEPVVIRLH